MQDLTLKKKNNLINTFFKPIKQYMFTTLNIYISRICKDLTLTKQNLINTSLFCSSNLSKNITSHKKLYYKVSVKKIKKIGEVSNIAW